MQHLSYIPEQFIPEAFFTKLKSGWMTNIPLFLANQLVAEAKFSWRFLSSVVSFCVGKDQVIVLALAFENTAVAIQNRYRWWEYPLWSLKESLARLLYHLKKEDAWCCHLNSPCGGRKTVLRWSVRSCETLLRRHVNSRSWALLGDLVSI